MQFLPVSPTETLIREIGYALPDDRREMNAARYLNWRINRRVNAEDTALINGVQQGMMSSSYRPGPLGRSEVCLRSFTARLRRLIPEARLSEPPPHGWSAR
jgi:phenylpropionate dioxygenase-like ring-hydroxylating dioxygenase large terminal subunit